MGMQIALTNTLTRRKVVCPVLLVLLAACGPQPWENVDSVTERLAQFEQECGFSVTLPTTKDDLEAVFAENRTHTYAVDMPLDGNTGDDIFPMTEAPEFAHGEIVSAIVAICPSRSIPWSITTRSPRFAFYLDESGNAFHVEDHSLHTSL
jgi:hypothetical protein